MNHGSASVQKKYKCVRQKKYTCGEAKDFRTFHHSLFHKSLIMSLKFYLKPVYSAIMHMLMVKILYDLSISSIAISQAKL